jgi:hypothetical protein
MNVLPMTPARIVAEHPQRMMVPVANSISITPTNNGQTALAVEGDTVRQRPIIWTNDILA